LINSV
jgi:cyclin-dependent kinase